MLLWISEAADEALDLGDPFRVWASFAELSRAAGSDLGWEALLSVPGFAEQEVEPAWATAVARQASRFRLRHGLKLTPHTRWLLDQLVTLAPARPRDRLPGGLADRLPAARFDPAQLEAGARVEAEHTDDPALAREIARDHLAEDPDYYRKLRQLERGHKAIGGPVAQWKEDLHPRGQGGRFGNKPGAPAGPAQPGPSRATKPDGQAGPRPAHVQTRERVTQASRDLAETLAEVSLDKLKKVGHKASHWHHVAHEWVVNKIAENVAKLPPKAQQIVQGCWHAIRLGTKAAFVSYTAGQALAEQVAVARGASPEEAARLRAAVSAIDLGACKPVALVVGAVSGGVAATAASFFPVGSLTYLAYSAKEDPRATLKGARTALAGLLPRRGTPDQKAFGEYGWVRSIGGPIAALREPLPAADAATDDEAKPALHPDAEALVGELYDALHEATDQDDFLAHFLTALDATQDMRPALALTRHVLLTGSTGAGAVPVGKAIGGPIQNPEFERQHPRGQGGRFSTKPGAQAGPSQPEQPSPPPASRKEALLGTLKTPDVRVTAMSSLDNATEAETLEVAHEFLKKPVPPGHLGALANSVDGAVLRIRKIKAHKSGLTPEKLELDLIHRQDGVRANRLLYFEDDGSLVCKNELFVLKDYSPYKGRGLELFVNQVLALQALGVQKIKTHAAGDPSDPMFNGYYTWPRMGYDGEIEPEDFDRLPAELREQLGDSRSILDLMELPGGKEAWRKHGGDIFEAFFDLADDSRSMRVLLDYVAERRERDAGRDQGATGKNWRSEASGRTAPPGRRGAAAPVAAGEPALRGGDRIAGGGWGTTPAVGLTKTAGPHTFGSTQLNLPADPAERIQRFSLTIPDEDLAADGREAEAHITVLYGLHATDWEDVRRVVGGFGPVRYRLGATAFFPAREPTAQRGGSDYDVLYVRVQSNDLIRLHQHLQLACAHTTTFPEYTPHVTVAYLKPGLGAKYAGLDLFDGTVEHETTELVFSNAAGARQVLALDARRPTYHKARAKSIGGPIADPEFESKHPRAQGGRFGNKPGGAGGATPSVSSQPALASAGGVRRVGQADQVAQALFGRGLTDDELTGLAGGWSGASRVTAAGKDGELELVLQDPAQGLLVECRVLRRAGKLVVHNDRILVNKRSQGQGVGTRMFAAQVAQARHLGIASIDCEAVRDPEWNGYYTWALLGSDGPLPRAWGVLGRPTTRAAQVPGCTERLLEAFRAHIASHDGALPSILDVLQMPDGRQLWKSWGQTVKLAFDLTEGSRSTRVFAAYLEERTRRGTTKAMANRPGGAGVDLRLDSEELQILESLWDAWARRGRVADPADANIHKSIDPDGGCPYCGADVTARCRCFRADSTCANGHSWHTCEVHGTLVAGPSDHGQPGCTCHADTPEDHTMLFTKVWKESDHPRDRNGRFIDKQRLAAAAHDRAAADALRRQVRPQDRAKLEVALRHLRGGGGLHNPGENPQTHAVQAGKPGSLQHQHGVSTAAVRRARAAWGMLRTAYRQASGHMQRAKAALVRAQERARQLGKEVARAGLDHQAQAQKVAALTADRDEVEGHLKALALGGAPNAQASAALQQRFPGPNWMMDAIAHVNTVEQQLGGEQQHLDHLEKVWDRKKTQLAKLKAPLAKAAAALPGLEQKLKRATKLARQAKTILGDVEEDHRQLKERITAARDQARAGKEAARTEARERKAKDKEHLAKVRARLQRENELRALTGRAMQEFRGLTGTLAQVLSWLTLGYVNLGKSAVPRFVKSLSRQTVQREAELIADIVGGLLGEDALRAFEDQPGDADGARDAPRVQTKAWREIDHPRGPDGRFIRKGSTEAVKQARKRVATTKKTGKATPAQTRDLIEHLANLTVVQLHALKREHGLKASGRLKAELVQKLAERLAAKGVTKLDPKKPKPGKPKPARKPAVKPKPEPEPKPVETERPVPPARLIDPTLPIGERIAAYERGQHLQQAMAQLSEERERISAEWKHTGQRMHALEMEHGSIVQYEGAQPLRGIAKQTREAMREYRDLKVRNEAAQRAYKDINAKAHALLAVPDSERAVWKQQPHNLSPEHQQAEARGTQFVQTLLARGATQPDWAPQQTVHTRGLDPASDNQRACYCTGYTFDVATVFLGKHNGTDIMVHELGHWLEDHCPGVGQAAQEFLRHRVGEEPAQKLRAVVPGSDYDEHEVGRRDDFGKAFGESGWYVGKDYQGQATEIMSMGLQLLYNNPLHFAQADPEYFQFVTGILDGSLRKPT